MKITIYRPYSKGLPSLKIYFTELRARREFILNYAKTEVLRQNLDSFFGQFWLLINPLALAGIYYILLYIVNGKGTNFLHIVSSILLYYFFSNSIIDSTKSVTGSVQLLQNSKFPRLILPISSVLIAFYKFIPTILIILGVKVITGSAINLTILFVIPILFISVILALGLAILTALLNVYFRDTQNMLPFIIRILMYLSPILYEGEQLPNKLKVIKILNPFYPILDSWSKVITHSTPPSMLILLMATLNSIIILILSVVLFISREREFSVRL